LKNTLIYTALLFTLYSCNEAAPPCDEVTDSQEENVEAPVATNCTPAEDSDDGVIPPDNTPVEGDVPPVAALFSASVSYTNFTAADKDKVESALIFIQRIVKTEEFRQKVLSHRYDGQIQFANNNGLTNSQIYQILLDGAEELKPEINHRMDLELQLYTNNFTSTVGYTYPNTLKIWMNRKFFNRYSSEEVARNVFHEWTHKLGFGHDSSATARRPYSVPYALGSIIQEMAEKLD
jgi:hypothetical protein